MSLSVFDRAVDCRSKLESRIGNYRRRRHLPLKGNMVSKYIMEKQHKPLEQNVV